MVDMSRVAPEAAFFRSADGLDGEWSPRRRVAFVLAAAGASWAILIGAGWIVASLV